MNEEIRKLYRTAYGLRKDAVDMVYHARTGHAAPCLSEADILTALYFHVMNLDPANPHWEDRDRFVLSKGHASPLYYAVLARRGYFPPEDLMEYRGLNTKLQGHPDMKKCPGVDFTTGSLGNGLAGALGMALIGKKDKKDYRVFAVCGDGELDEGIIWEAATYAGNEHLGRLIVFVDNNGLQSGGAVEKIQDLGDIAARFEACKWHTQTIDGHDMEAILNAVAEAEKVTDKPSVIVAKTIKGKGVSFMEGQYLWHMKAPNDEQYAIACEELERKVKEYE